MVAIMSKSSECHMSSTGILQLLLVVHQAARLERFHGQGGDISSVSGRVCSRWTEGTKAPYHVRSPILAGRERTRSSCGPAGIKVARSHAKSLVHCLSAGWRRTAQRQFFPRDCYPLYDPGGVVPSADTFPGPLLEARSTYPHPHRVAGGGCTGTWRSARRRSGSSELKITKLRDACIADEGHIDTLVTQFRDIIPHRRRWEPYWGMGPHPCDRRTCQCVQIISEEMPRFRLKVPTASSPPIRSEPTVSV